MMVPRKEPYISEAMFSTIIAGIVAIFLGYMQYSTKVSVVQSAEKVEIVKTTLDEAKEEIVEKVDEIVVTTDKVHGLVNSNMAIQLKISAVALRRLADLTKNPTDIQAAELAEASLEEHMRKQKIVDEKDERRDKAKEEKKKEG